MCYLRAAWLRFIRSSEDGALLQMPYQQFRCARKIHRHLLGLITPSRYSLGRTMIDAEAWREGESTRSHVEAKSRGRARQVHDTSCFLCFLYFFQHS